MIQITEDIIIDDKALGFYITAYRRSALKLDLVGYGHIADDLAADDGVLGLYFGFHHSVPADE